MKVVIILLIMILVIIIALIIGLYLGYRATVAFYDEQIETNIKLNCFIHKNRVYGIKDITPKSTNKTDFEEAINYGKN